MCMKQCSGVGQRECDVCLYLVRLVEVKSPARSEQLDNCSMSMFAGFVESIKSILPKEIKVKISKNGHNPIWFIIRKIAWVAANVLCHNGSQVFLGGLSLLIPSSTITAAHRISDYWCTSCKQSLHIVQPPSLRCESQLQPDLTSRPLYLLLRETGWTDSHALLDGPLLSMDRHSVTVLLGDLKEFWLGIFPQLMLVSLVAQFCSFIVPGMQISVIDTPELSPLVLNFPWMASDVSTTECITRPCTQIQFQLRESRNPSYCYIMRGLIMGWLAS